MQEKATQTFAGPGSSSTRLVGSFFLRATHCNSKSCSLKHLRGAQLKAAGQECMKQGTQTQEPQTRVLSAGTAGFDVDFPSPVVFIFVFFLD